MVSIAEGFDAGNWQPGKNAYLQAFESTGTFASRNFSLFEKAMSRSAKSKADGGIFFVATIVSRASRTTF
jgi:hypothetical protein